MVLKHWLQGSRFKQLLLVAVALALAFIFVDIVAAPTPGLDASWIIALSKAHSQGLLWGRDIIFTYGPFGYLFFGSLIDTNYLEMQLSRYLLHFLWAWLALRFSLQLETKLLRLLSILVFIVIPTIFNVSEIKFILIVLLMILEISKSQPKHNSRSQIKFYLYGVLSALFLLVKLNSGILSSVCFTLTLLVNFLVGKIRGTAAVRQLLETVPWILFGFCSGVIIFFSPLSRLPLLGLLIACMPGVATVLLLRVRKVAALLQEQPIGYALLGLSAGSLALFLGLSSEFRSFIAGSLQITSGYSQSMGTIGPQVELTGGFILLAPTLLIAASVFFNRPANIGACLSILLFLLMSFKHGFIRHDGHVVYFAASLPAYIFALGLLSFDQKPRLSPPKFLWMLLLTASTAFFLALGLENSGLTKYYDVRNYGAFFNPSVLTQKLSLLANFKATERDILSKPTLAPSLMDSPARASLEGKTVDVFPWEVSLVQANQLKWQPVPIFQAYSAYTRWLDQKNLRSYQQRPPDRILYHFHAIDGRYPVFEQPQTTLYTLCNYRPFGRDPFFSAQSLGEVAVLRQRNSPLCSAQDLIPVSQTTTGWNESLSLDAVRESYANEPGNLLLMQVDIHYTRLGKLYNSLFRTPPIYARFWFGDGSSKDYRLVIDTAKSGLVVSSLSDTIQDLMKVFAGQDGTRRPSAVAFYSVNQSVFAPTIDVKFERLKKQITLPKNFKPTRYLERNPDVKAAGLDPAEHFLKYGFFEGRQW